MNGSDIGTRMESERPRMGVSACLLTQQAPATKAVKWPMASC